MESIYLESNSLALGTTGHLPSSEPNLFPTLNPSNRPTQLVVIDSSVEDYATLLEGLDKSATVLHLDAAADGVLQINAALQQLQNLESIHLISHGDSGEIQLGATQLNADTLVDYRSTLEGWESILSDTADILVYGCKVGEDIAGQTFLDQLSQWTGADIAASTDITGNAARGGDWELEYQTGTIEAQQPFSLEALANFRGILLPPGFQNELVLDGVSQPIALENAPNGQMLVAFRDGEIKSFNPASSQPVLQDYLTVQNTFKAKETGLMDIRLDTDGYLYTYYSSAVTDKATISRWNMNNASPVEEIIWEDVDTLDGTVFHIGGTIDFGPDDKVWLTIGDKFKPILSSDLSNHSGKIIRINKDGSIPDGSDGSVANPYAIDNDPTTLPEIWASGVRNPFRASWDIESGRFFFGDVGGNDNNGADASWEEINVATLNDAGATYGWSTYEGPVNQFDPTPPSNYIEPLYAWQHDEAGAAVIGGLVYRGTVFPEQYQGAYFFSNFVDQTIEYITFDNNGDVVGDNIVPNAANGGGTGGNVIFQENAGAISEFQTGADGALYYLDISRRGDNSGNGSVRRISYIGAGNTSPEITNFSTNAISGSPPLTVNFSVTATDAENDALTYRWDLDGDPSTGSSFAGVDGLWEDVTTVGSTSYSYTQPGTYRPLVIVSDGTLSDRSDDEFPTAIQVGSAPTVSITAPESGIELRAGVPINLEAIATDSEDGNLTGSSLVWDFVLFHNDHNHPDPAAATGTTVPFEFNTSGHNYFGDVYYNITVTATDSDGLTASDSIIIAPEESISTFDSFVLNTGGRLPGNDNPIALESNPLVSEPFTFDNVIGFQNTIEAETIVVREGARYTFAGWSDGEADALRNITIPETDTAFTANYNLVNYLPEAVDDNASVEEGGASVSIEVLANDSDLDAETLSLTSFSQASNGTVARDNNGTAGDTTDDKLVYTPDAGFTGADSFTYTIEDSFGDSATATVSIQVGEPTVGAPVRGGLVLELNADQGVTTDGTKVTGWLDQSGLGNDLTGAGDPQLAVGALNGHNVIQFDTNGDKLTRVLETLNGLPAGDSERSIFMVAKYNEAGYGGFGYGKTKTNQAFGLNVDAEGELMVQGWSGADMLTNELGTGQGWLSQAAIVAANPNGGSAEQVTHYKDGVLIDTQSRNFNTAAENLVLGSNLKGRNSLDMEVAEILVYDRALSEAERSEIEAYLQQKYDLGAGDPGEQTPTATDDSVEVDVNSNANTLAVLSNDSDPNGDPLIITAVSDTANGGTVGINSLGTELLYTPAAGYTGIDSFTYTIDDGDGNTDTATVTVTVNGGSSSGSVDAVDDAFSVIEGSTNNSLDVLGNDTAGSTPSTLDFSTYEVLESSQSTLRTIRFEHPISGGGLDNVDFVFDASPAGGDDPHFHMMGETMTSPFLTQHNTGGNGTELNFVMARSDGQAFAFDGFSYTSGQFFPGTNAEFTVVGTLAGGGTVSQTFGPATAEQTFQSATLDGAGWKNVVSVRFLGSVSTTGADIGQELNIDDLIVSEARSLSIVSVGSVSNGSATVSTNGSDVVYTPDANFSGSDSFTYTITDGTNTDTATVTVTVEGTNDAPAATNDRFSTTLDNAITFAADDLLANDSDPDGDAISVDTIGSPTNGSLTDNQDGTYTYTPDAGFTGTDTFAYTITDSVETAQAQISITVSNAPSGGPLPTGGLVLRLDADQGVTTDGTKVTGWLDQSGLGNDLTGAGDPQLAVGALNGHNVIQFDTNGDKLTRVLETLNGLPAGDSERSIFMVAKYNEAGYGGFGYGKTKTNQAFGLNVDAEGELMVQGWSGADMLTNELGTGQGWLSQAAIVAANPNGGSAEQVTHYKDGVLIDTQSRNFNTAAENLVLGSNLKGRNSLDMEVAEILVYDRALSEAERLQVEEYFQQKYFGAAGSANQSPSANSDSLEVSVSSTDNVIDVLNNDSDPEGDPIALESFTQPALGSVTRDDNGTPNDLTDDSLLYSAPTDGSAGNEVLNYTISDSAGNTDVGTVNVTVTSGAPNTPPDAVDDSFSVNEDSLFSGNVFDGSLSGLDTDADEEDVFTVLSNTDPLTGQVTFSANGNFTYTPDANFSGTDSFTYTITDDSATDTATVTVTVNGINDTPDANDDSFSTTVNDAITFALSDLLANDSDVDGDSLSLDTLNQPTNGVIIDNQDGTYTYQPDADYSGTDSFTYIITDGIETAQAEVSITISTVPTGGTLPTEGLVLQLDADQGVSTNGSEVTAWADQSGLGNDLIAGGDPQLAVGALNGHNVIQFDTNGDKLERSLEATDSLPAGDSERSVFMVAKYNEAGYGGFGYGNTSNNQAFGLNVDTEGELMVQGWSSGDMLTNELGTGQGWLSQSAIVSSNTSGGNNEQVSHYKDGTLIDTQSRDFNTVLDTLVVGSNLKGRNSIDMEVAEILVYNRALSEAERLQVEAYLKQKYAL